MLIAGTLYALQKVKYCIRSTKLWQGKTLVNLANQMSLPIFYPARSQLNIFGVVVDNNFVTTYWFGAAEVL